MNCPYCGTNHPDDTQFKACPHCGAPHQPLWARHCSACGNQLDFNGSVPKAAVEVKKCPDCGLQALRASAAFCPACGHNFAANTSELSPRIVVNCQGSGAVLKGCKGGGDWPVLLSFTYGKNVLRLSQFEFLCEFKYLNFTDHLLVADKYCIQSIEFVNTKEFNFPPLGFRSCANLESLNLEDINTELWMTIHGMFQACCKLKQLDLSTFKTSKIVQTAYAFDGCSSLETLDISGWDLCQVKKRENYKSMFAGCKSLRKIMMHGCNAFTIDLIETALEEANLVNVQIVG